MNATTQLACPACGTERAAELRAGASVFECGCGELLDVDGPIGGFNFQAAFATGRLAGLHA